MSQRLRILFLCTANSARSQMAEGWARWLAGKQYEIYSAGTAPTCLNPLAVAVMNEKGVDITRQRSKSLTDVPNQSDYVITLCAEAEAACPTLPARQQRLAWHLPDPAAAPGDVEEKRRAFRQVRNEIERRVRALLDALKSESKKA